MAITQSFMYGLSDAKIAVWNAAQSYGTALDVESVKVFGVELDMESGELEGDDIITDSHSKIQAANITLGFGLKDNDVLAILTGVTNTVSTNTESMIFGRDNMPYFAICGRVDKTTGGGDMWLFIPKVKLMSGLNFSMAKGAYIEENVSARAHYESTVYGVMKLIHHATATAVTIPPT
jgi:hypothetical protein